MSCDVLCSQMHWQAQDERRKLIRRHALHFKRGAKIAVPTDVRAGAVSATGCKDESRTSTPLKTSGTIQKDEFLVQSSQVCQTILGLSAFIPPTKL